MRKIVEGVYTIVGLVTGRVYVIVNSDGLTLIDASVEGAEKGIARDLARHGYTLKEIRRILVTHAHPDHIGALAALVKASSAQVYAHTLEAPIVRGEKPLARPEGYKDSEVARRLFRLIGIKDMPPTHVDRELQEGDTLPEVLPNLQVISTPGHAYGHVAFYDPDRKLLFAGDAITRFGKLGLPIAQFTPDMAEAKRSIKKLANMPIDILCFGHGVPMLRNTAARLRAFAAKL